MIKIKVLRNIVSSIVKLYCIVVYKIEIKGIENIPKEGPVIFCGNHRSFLDAILLELYTPRRMRFMSKKELEKNKFLNFFVKLYDSIPVQRAAKDLTAIKESIKTLKNGGCLGIFPEGTRNGLEKSGEMKNGATYIAIKTGASIIPIGIKGKMKLFNKITVTYGEKIDYTEYAKQKLTKEIEESTTKQLKEAIIELTK